MESSASPVDPSAAGLFRPDGRGRGLRDGTAIRPGLAIARANVVYEGPAHLRIECPGRFLRFHFKLGGWSEISDERRGYAAVEPGRISIVAQANDVVKRERVERNTHERSVTLVCSPEFAAEIFAPIEDAPQIVRDFLRARSEGVELQSMPLPICMWPLIQDILKPPLMGVLGTMFTEAKAVELLCMTVHQLVGYKPAGVRLRDRDRQRVRQICGLLEERPSSPLNVAALCRELAWNESQMMQCFKAVTGTTMSNYRHALVMNQAKRLLQESDRSVTEIAFDAGYEHPSNFATAFKRAFGYPPSSVRHEVNH